MPNSAINLLLRSVGIAPLKLINNDLGVVIGLTHVFLGCMVLALMTSMSKISDNLLVAASNLGANGFQMLWKIVVPLSMPGIVAGSVLVFSMSASTYATPVLLGGSASQVVAAEIYDRALNFMEFDAAAALSVILFVVALTIVLGGCLAERGCNRVVFE